MELSKRKFHNPELAAQHRKETIAFKDGAIFIAFLDLDGLLNKTALSKQYFGKTQGWFSQKLNGATVCDKERSFTVNESHHLAEAFRDIAKRLIAPADEIDNAE